MVIAHFNGKLVIQLELIMSQFFYVHPDNPQGRLMKQAAAIISQGGVIVYPTEYAIFEISIKSITLL